LKPAGTWPPLLSHRASSDTRIVTPDADWRKTVKEQSLRSDIGPRWIDFAAEPVFPAAVSHQVRELPVRSEELPSAPQVAAVPAGYFPGSGHHVAIPSQL